MNKNLRDIEQEFQELYLQEKPKKEKPQKEEKAKKVRKEKRKLPIVLDIVFFGSVIAAGILVVIILRGGHLVSARGVNEAFGVPYILMLIICVVLIVGTFTWRFKINKKM